MDVKLASDLKVTPHVQYGQNEHLRLFSKHYIVKVCYFLSSLGVNTGFDTVEVLEWYKVQYKCQKPQHSITKSVVGHKNGVANHPIPPTTQTQWYPTGVAHVDLLTTKKLS